MTLFRYILLNTLIGRSYNLVHQSLYRFNVLAELETIRKCLEHIAEVHNNFSMGKAIHS